MSSVTQAQITTAAPAASFTPGRSDLVQRKCACGGTPGVDGECAACRTKRLAGARSSDWLAPPPGAHSAPPMPQVTLDTDSRSFMQSLGGHDLAQVAVLPMLQPKLTVGRPDDPFEQEADRVAAAITGPGTGPAPGGLTISTVSPTSATAQRCAECGKDDETPLGGVATEDDDMTNVGGVPGTGGYLQAQCAGRQDGNGRVTPGLEDDVTRLRGGGESLAAPVRGFFENRLGHDFSRVRVHTGASAGATARALGALAYTMGNDIVFGAGQYAPETSDGRRLLAHELTHVVQQGAAGPLPTGARTNSAAAGTTPASSLSRNTTGGPAPAQSTAGPVARQAGGAPAVQCDLAVEPAHPAAVAAELTDAQIQEAIRFNQFRFKDPWDIRNVRDVMGLAPTPAIIDEEFVLAVAQWQAEQGLHQDGKLGAETTRTFLRELRAEDQRAKATDLARDNFVTTSTIGGPTYNNCTALPRFRWDVTMSTSLRNGFIIQQIDNVWNPQNCAGAAIALPANQTPTPRYWEAWQVNNAGVVAPTGTGGHNDRWQRFFPPNTRGTWRMTGTFFTVLTLPAAPGFAAGNVPDAGILQSTVTAPRSDDLGLAAGRRTIGGTWNCCAPTNTHTRT